MGDMGSAGGRLGGCFLWESAFRTVGKKNAEFFEASFQGFQVDLSL